MKLRFVLARGPSGVHTWHFTLRKTRSTLRHMWAERRERHRSVERAELQRLDRAPLHLLGGLLLLPPLLLPLLLLLLLLHLPMMMTREEKTLTLKLLNCVQP
jgi:hypothetical protein